MRIFHGVNLGAYNDGLDPDTQLNNFGEMMEKLCDMVSKNYATLNEFLQISAINNTMMLEPILKQCYAGKKAGHTEKTGFALQVVSNAFE
jgi:hypothetical protein